MFIFGRTGKRCFRVLADFDEGNRFKLMLKDIFFLRMFKDLLTANIPREICALKSENVVVFTDACYEREADAWPCGLGGVVCFGNNISFFSLPVGLSSDNFLGSR